MKTQSSTINVADYCKGLERKEFIVNSNYQRSDKVWPLAAKSFLIETIILDYPVPKLSLHQKLDLETRSTRKEIVDGQQRSRAILDFYNDEYKLSSTLLTERLAGRKFSSLDDSDKAQFLDYGLNFDVFVGAQPEDVREVFRRMNSFTVPLNNEEARHANYQGDFKWFIHALSREYDRAFQEAGVFSEKQINRMVDAKLLTEVSHALLTGISTTAKSSLDKLYETKDQSFPEADELRNILSRALDATLGAPELRGTALLKPYNVYALVLAFCVRFGWVLPGQQSVPIYAREYRHDEPAFNLSVLAQAIADYDDSDDEEESDALSGPAGAEQYALSTFVAATKERTNVAAQRRTRYSFFLGALTA